MKNIVICCDGTGKDFGDENSNIVKLFSVLKKEEGKQIVYYDPGVGTPSTYNSFNPITKKLKYVMGQAFGYGINDNIMEAYHFLMKNYTAGDQVSLFGFSRGAYTVRAIAGLIHTCGLMYNNNENLLPEAMRIYSQRKYTISRDFKSTFSRPCPIHFLGLFDTVTSVGWVYNPRVLRATTNNSSVSNVRHAIALDERRAFFRQNTWGRKHWNKQDAKEVWFAGVHSDIGGGYALDKSALSNITLEWMLKEAIEKGILIENLDNARRIVNSIAEPHIKEQNISLKSGWYAAELFPKIVKVKRNRKNKKPKWVPMPYINLGRKRFIRNQIVLHESVIKRIQERKDYRPKNFPGIKGGVQAIQENYEIEPWIPL